MINGHPEWEIEIWFLSKYYGMPEIDARAFVIERWMRLGDLRPLAAAIEAGPLDPPVAHAIGYMINNGRLKVVKSGPPRP
jgi:hypothetical protein